MKQGRQGCPLSSWLLNILLDIVVREAMVQFKGGVKLDVVACTDHVVCIPHSSDDTDRDGLD